MTRSTRVRVRAVAVLAIAAALAAGGAYELVGGIERSSLRTLLAGAAAIAAALGAYSAWRSYCEVRALRRYLGDRNGGPPDA